MRGPTVPSPGWGGGLYLAHRACTAVLAASLLAGLVPALPAFAEPLPPLTTLQLSPINSWTDSTGAFRVVGEVSNQDPAKTARFIQVQCTIHDLTNPLHPALTETVSTEASMLKPADGTHPPEKSPFQVSFPTPPASHDAPTCAVSGNASTAVPNHDFAVSIASVTTDADGIQLVKGTITNTRSTTVNHVKLMLSYYSSPGTPIDETSHYLPTDANSSLGPSPTPGATATFTFERYPPPDEPAWSYASSSLLATLAESPAPTTQLLPAAIDFGGQIELTQSAPQTVTLSNIGDGDLHIGSATLNNTADFGITANRCPAALPAGQSCGLDIVFHPMGQGLPQPYATGATLTVVDDAVGLSHNVAITGTGLSRSGASLNPATLDFGEQPVTTTSAPQTITLTSLGPDPLSHITVGASRYYVIATDTCTRTGSLAVGSTCTVSVSFSPGTTGQLPGTLSINDDGRYNPQTVSLTGKGTVLGLSIAPPIVDFGTRLLGTTSAPQTVTMSNIGNATATLGTVALAGPNGADFAIATDQCSNAVLTASAPACTVTVTFSPTAAGSRAGVLDFAVSGRAAPLTVLLVGVGQYPTPPPLFGGAYQPLQPARVLDTRYGPTPVGLGLGAVGRGQTIDVQIMGRGGVPDTGVSAVVVNVTVTQTDGYGYLTIYPTQVNPGPPPTSSNLNWSPGQTVPNLVEVAVGNYGRISIFNGAGSSAHIIVDVAGFVSMPTLTPGRDGRFVPAVPARILDTRSGPAPANAGLGKVGPGQTINVQVVGAGGLPATGVEAVVLNVTVTGPTDSSFLTVFPAGSPLPLASNLNFVAGQTVPNRVIVKVGTGGAISIYNGSGSVHIIVDVNGWYTDDTAWQISGSGFTGLAPMRVLDTRFGTQDTGSPIGAMGAGTTMVLPVAGRGGVPGMGAQRPPKAVVLNVTVTRPSADGYLTIWPGLSPGPPLASDLNFTAGQTVPNLVVVEIGSDGTIQIYSGNASTDVVGDVVGWYG